ncbi:Fur family transcriptional regulator [uncultured Cytophaga sp.]|uniref:Fur family transcriptional regulator n=1 Tax=uncultured Cytophaga sp. TaxID=160238 RepID=UPI002607814C|nr:Fur family transcriptional regulator [uncultured Cytophaga sp.]
MQKTLSFEEIKDKISDYGLKATHQRLVVYDALQKTSLHPSAEDVYDLIHLDNPSITLATIYNTLDSFVEAKLISKVSTEAGKSRYDFNTHQHHHIYLSNTDEIIDYHDPELQQLLSTYLTKKKFKNITIQDFRVHIKAEIINPDKKISLL